MQTLLSRSIVARLAAYYGAFTLVLIGAWTLLPAPLIAFLEDLHTAWISLSPVGAAPAGIFDGSASAPAGIVGGATLATVASITGFLLALPVAWVYMHTRRKKGYTQSVVHSLILLPVLVAAVVVLVKNSLALAFALAGIVAAVRFRNTLDDSKDAVYIFMATVLGLAAGAQPGVAIALSVLFNVVVLTLWYSDFARTPPGLEDERARKKMQKALELANRTSQFVARLDSEVLEAMGPAQLDALADRVRRRRADVGAEEEVRGGEASREGTLRVTMLQSTDARSTVEEAFAPFAKRWSVQRVEHGGDGHEVVVYWIRMRKSAVPSAMVSAVELAGRGMVQGVDFQERN